MNRAHATTRMLVDLTALRQQMWRGATIMDAFRAYAKQIGCTTYEDGPACDAIECHTAKQERLLAKWWREKTHG